MIGCNNHTAAIEYVVFAQVFLVDAKHVGRRGGIGLHVIVERKPIDVAQIAGFVHP
jgi:hypothetical protein